VGHDSGCYESKARGYLPHTYQSEERGVVAFIDKTTEIAADIHNVYELWTAFEDYPTFMETIETVTVVPDDQLHWVAVVEDDTFEWDADIVEHVPDEKITWRALDGRETGEVRFEKVGAGTTKVTYQLKYDPAVWAGKADAVRRWMNRRVDKDLENFKEMVEAVA
jgi:uncharacterized membrane protein